MAGKPAALTAKQEMFCQALVMRKMTQTAAYSHAYDTGNMAPDTITDKASKLARTDVVSARIKVLTERATAVAVKKAGLTLADEIAACSAVLEDAQSLGQASAAVAAIKLRAQLGGHLVERKEVSTKGPLDETDVAKLTALKREIDIRIAASKDADALVGGEPAAPAPLLRRVI